MNVAVYLCVFEEQGVLFVRACVTVCECVYVFVSVSVGVCVYVGVSSL